MCYVCNVTQEVRYVLTVGSRFQFYVFVILGSLMASAVSTAISGLQDRFFHMPWGCAEQNMYSTAPIVYALYYLKQTGHVNADAEKNGPLLIKKGN